MKIFNRKINGRYAIWILLNILIVLDIALITFVIFFNPPVNIAFHIQLFDFCVCIVLLFEWAIRFYISKPKKIFLRQWGSWIDLIASIPFDVILPAVVPSVGFLRYLRLFKFLRLFALFNRFFNSFERFVKASSLDRILGGVFLTVLTFTFLLFIFGSTYNLFDDFYFVIVTLTTVGYGDVIPVTFNEKVISLILLILGVFIFSTITAAISSYLTDRLLNNNENMVKEDLINIKSELEQVHSENKELKQEISELKELIIKNNDEF